MTTVEPAHYPTYRGGETLPEGKNTRIAVGGLAGFVICRVGGANYIVSIGCAAIGGLVGGSTYNPAHDIRTDGEFLINQVAVLRVGEFRSRNSLVRPDLTNHISVLQE